MLYDIPLIALNLKKKKHMPSLFRKKYVTHLILMNIEMIAFSNWILSFTCHLQFGTGFNEAEP